MKRTKKQIGEEILKYKAYEKNDKWYGYRECPDCKNEILQQAFSCGVLLRNIRNLDKRSAPCSSCNKKGDKNHFFGKFHTEKSKKQNSESRKGKACGSGNAMANIKNRQKISNTLKNKYDSGDLDYLKEIQRKTAIKNQANGKLKTAPISKAEKEIRKIIEDIGYEVIPQFNIGSLKYDLFIKDINLLIEYNGDYWHCNPEKYDDKYFHKKKKMTAKDIWKKDEEKIKLAISSGFKIITIWESKFISNKESEIKKILKIL